MSDAPKKKIIDILNEHGSGKGKDKSGVDDDKEDELNTMSKMVDDDGDGPVPEELKPYTEKESQARTPFERGYWRTLKVALEVVPGKARFTGEDTKPDAPKKKAPAAKKPATQKGKFDDVKYVDPLTTTAM